SAKDSLRCVGAAAAAVGGAELVNEDAAANAIVARDVHASIGVAELDDDACLEPLESAILDEQVVCPLLERDAIQIVGSGVPASVDVQADEGHVVRLCARAAMHFGE